MHVVKNKLVDMGLLGEDLRVPLILGVWCALLSFYGSVMQIELVGSLLPHSQYAPNSAGAYACNNKCPAGVPHACHCCRGGKGQGKSFQTELAMKKLGIEPVIMSAGVCPLRARPHFVR